MSAFTLIVPGIPQPQGSTRAFVVKGRAVVTSANPKVKSWRADAMAALSQHDEVPHFTGGVLAELIFVFPRPVIHYNSKGVVKDRFAAMPKATKPDVDKLARSGLDFLTMAGIVKDDAQVTRVTASKRFVQEGEVPYSLIYVREWEEMASVAAVQNLPQRGGGKAARRNELGVSDESGD